MWTIGVADRLRFPRLPSTLGKRIPTGTIVNKEFDTDDRKGRIVAPAVAPTAIGADIEIGRATP
jgi:hypothetical protein